MSAETEVELSLKGEICLEMKLRLWLLSDANIASKKTHISASAALGET
jgi:hypothetical protein